MDKVFVSRGLLKDYDAGGPQHLAGISGYSGEIIPDTVRMQQFGQSSSPPVGSHVLFMRLGASSDKVMLIGIDHPNYGPRDLASGEHCVFDAHQHSVELRADGLLIKAPDKIVFSVGDISLRIDKTGFHFEGGPIFNDGVNIGSTHVHSGVSSGPTHTGVPE